MNRHDETGRGRGVVLFLAAAFLISFLVKLANVKVGAPYVTIDDDTTFNGGFLVWFGHSPPQRMFLESWLCGLTSLGTYVFKVLQGQVSGGLSIDLVTDAYKDFYNAPDTYVHVYRVFVLLLDMLTAWMVYRLGRLVLKSMWQGWAAALAAAFYLFSYNTVWCNVVARPDALVAVFSTIGLFFYYDSRFGQNNNRFWLAAVCLGIAAGLKLHAALFVIFIIMDLWRVHGWRRALPLAIPLAVISLVCFGLAAGMPLFDPLRYIKLRMLNVKDDQSPWIQWGEQFLAIARGSGWIVVPVILWGAWGVIAARKWRKADSLTSVIFLSVCWIVLFASIRQLRAYWMLPVLPLFYIGFLGIVAHWQRKKTSTYVIFVVLMTMVIQTGFEAYGFQRINFNSLRNWIKENVSPHDAIYIVGFEALALPKSNLTIENQKEGVLGALATDRLHGTSFVNMHVKNWEEETALVLFDMLRGRPEFGWQYYSAYSTPLHEFEGILDINMVEYVLVQDGFNFQGHGLEVGFIQENFVEIQRLSGPGGGGSGLGYTVLQRRN